MKIHVPEEFQIFLENAENIVSEYEDADGLPDLYRVTSDLAKFQYYLRGRLHELEAVVESLKGVEIDIIDELHAEYANKVKAISSLIITCSNLSNLVHDAVNPGYLSEEG